jgi:uncharacterized membrane protein
MPGIGFSLQNIPQQWRYAVIGGVIALPFTAFGYWQTGSELSLSPVLFGGLLAGYLAKRQAGESRGVGIRAGLIGGIPILWAILDILSATSALGGPEWFITGATVLTVGFSAVVAVLGFVLAAFIGKIGAKLGGWLAGKQPTQPNFDGN